MRLIIDVPLLALCLAQPLSSQPAGSAPSNLAGCYSITRGPWGRPFDDSTYHKFPEIVSLDSAPAEHGGWQLRPNMPYYKHRQFPGTPRWTLRGDTIQLAWSDGFVPTIVALRRLADGTLSGRAVALTDAHYDGERPPPKVDVIARPTKCPSGFDESSARAMIAAPRGLDSLAAVAWVASQKRTCRGEFLTVSDEVIELDKSTDTLVARYVRVLAGVQCLPKR